VLITNHVLSGAVIGTLAPNVPTAFAIGFGSHFLLDSVPHFGVPDDRLMAVAVPDGLVGLATLAVVAAASSPEHRVRVLAGVAGACLPDLDKPGEQFFDRSPFPRWFDRAHFEIQRESPGRWWVELIAAAAFAGVARAVLPRR
jgi:hypothetical protein